MPVVCVGIDHEARRVTRSEAANIYLIKTGTDANPGIHGALQGRREIVKGKPTFGFECTIGVPSVDETIAAVEANGGKIVMPKFHLPTVGTLIFFEDTEGNVVGAMQFETVDPVQD